MRKIKIDGTTVGSMAECTYLKYEGQTGQQSAHIEIDTEVDGCDVCVSIEPNAEIGNGVPERVWNRRAIRLDVCPNLTDEEADALADRIAPLAAELYAGDHLTIEWNGHNHVGTRSERGDEILDEIRNMVEGMEGSHHVWDAGDWFVDGGALLDGVEDALKTRDVATVEQALTEAADLELAGRDDVSELTGVDRWAREEAERLVARALESDESEA